MTLYPSQHPTLVPDRNRRDAQKPAWRKPVCRLVPLPAATQFDLSSNGDSMLQS
jgi:hypothetical protein